MGKTYISYAASVAVASLVLIGCGGGSSTTTSTTSTVTGSSTSILSLNPNLANVDYDCGQGTKQTSSNGEFNYNTGDECTFYIGGKQLKITPNSNEISMQKLVDANENVSIDALAAYFYAAGKIVNDVLTIPSSYKTQTKNITDFSSEKKIQNAILENENISEDDRKTFTENIAQADFDKQVEFANRLDISFKEIATPTTDEAKNTQQASTKVRVNGQEQEISYTTIMRTGYEDNGEILGQSKDYQDNAITFSDGSAYVCRGTNTTIDGESTRNPGSGMDFTSLHKVNGKLYAISQYECGIGSFYKVELEQNEQGVLSTKKGTLEFISQKDEFGGWVHCAGQVTPWNSHLSSEEYEEDAKLTAGTYLKDVGEKYWNDASKASAYYYGWTPEVSISNDGTASYKKHYAMGRFSHELSYVMPDNKTVYMSDDGTNVGFFMFVADTPKDLSAGTLYAAKWNQTSGEGAGEADLTWVNLGHATNSEIREYLDKDGDVTTNDALTFSDIFDSVAGTDGSCPSEYNKINTSAGFECLAIKEGMEKAASRLEVRRYAAIKGATTEFRKEEGITFDEANGKLYVAMSSVERGMEDDSSNDLGGYNHIRVEQNKCGAVYALDLNTGTTTDTTKVEISSNYVVKNMYSILEGKPLSYSEDSIYANNSCDVNGISNPDNVTFLPNSNILTIGEDTGKHENNVVWAYNVKTKELTRTFTTPLGAETTSPFWYTDLANGYGYLAVVTQHPGTSTTDGGESAFGYVGPFKNLTTIDSIEKIATYDTDSKAGTEIVAYDKDTNKMFTTNGKNNALDISTLNSDGTVDSTSSISLSTYGDGVNSVATKNGVVAVAVEKNDVDGIRQKGSVVIFDTNGTHQATVEAGYLPDMVTFNEDGTLILVANEGEPNSDYSHDPKGSIGIINVSNQTYKDLNFDEVSIPSDVIIKTGSLAPLDLEPEYITVSGTKAYVTLQENNALAIVDLTEEKITSVVALGFKDHSKAENAIDIEENEKIELKTFKNLYGMYQPDSIASYLVDNETYLVTANEGDGREYGDKDDNTYYTNEKKIKALDLVDSLVSVYADDNDLKVNDELGKNANDEYEKLYAFGARSFSIWDSNGSIVFDSKNHLSKLTAKYMPTLFNQDDGDIDERSGNKGVEPEALTVGKIGNKTYAFVGLERQNAIVVYDITIPTDAKFVKYIITENDGDKSPEGMKFVEASDSPTGNPLLFVAYEISGTTSIYEIKMQEQFKTEEEIL